MPRLFIVLCGVLFVFCSALAQSPISGFPPGTFQSRAPLDAAAAGGNVVTVDAANCNQGTMQYKASAGTQTLTGVTVTSTFTTLVVTVGMDVAGATTTPTVVSLTWDAAGANQALSLIKESNLTSLGADAQLWGAVGITAGAGKTITLITTNSAPVFLDACAFAGADQTGGTTTFPNATSANSASTINVTSAVGNIVMATGYSGSALGAITGTTIYSDSVSGAIINSFANRDAGAASVTIGAGNALAGLAGTDIKAAP